MPLTLSTAPTLEPVTLAETKAWLRVDIDDDDALIDSLITAARVTVENYCNRAFLTQTWIYTLDRFANPKARRVSGIEIPRAPLQSVSQIAYTDSDGASQVLSTDVYEVDTASDPGVVRLKWDQSWPSVLYHPNSVAITFVAGYGDDRTDVPQPIRAAIMAAVANYYENREPVIVQPGISTPAMLPQHAEYLLWQYRETLH